MKSRHIWSFTLLSMLLLGLYLADVFYFSRQSVLYPNFGISIPAGYTTHGIDVSHYQKRIDWKLASSMIDKGQQLSFAIVKATEGLTNLDPFFDRNWEEIEETNLIRGAYLYFHPNRSGKSQAAFFIKQVELKSGDLPPIIDIEESNGVNKNTLKKELQACLDALEKHYHATPLLYANVDFYESHLEEDFDNYPLWAAHYVRSTEPRISREWTIWQHSDKGSVNGIEAKVDFNVVNGGLSELMKLCL